MLFSFECGGWFWRRDAEITLLKSADVRLPTSEGPRREGNEASAFGGYYFLNFFKLKIFFFQTVTYSSLIS